MLAKNYSYRSIKAFYTCILSSLPLKRQFFFKTKAINSTIFSGLIYSLLFVITVFSVHGQSITTSTVTGNIIACVGTASETPDVQRFTVSGTNLMAAVTATAPTHFEVSTSLLSGYSSTMTLTPSNGTLASTLIYVRSASSAPVGAIAGTVSLSSTGAVPQSVSVAGKINALPKMDAVQNQIIDPDTSTDTVNFTGLIGSMMFNWTNSNPSIGLVASGSGSIPAFTAINNT